MGEVAVYILKNDSDWRFFRNDHGAPSLPVDLFYGPSSAFRYIERQQVAHQWPPALECGGGALVDEANRTLLLPGGNEVQRLVGTHRCYLRMMAYSWPAWTVRWAYEKLGDLLDYLGLDKQALCSEANPPLVDHLLLEGEVTPAPLFTVNQMAYYVDRRLDDWLLHGPSLLEDPEFPGGYSNWHGDEIPLEGAHFDLKAKTLNYWSTDARVKSLPCYKELWPDWRVTYHRDRFEDQLERNPTISFPSIHWGWEFQNLSYQLGPGRQDASPKWIRQMKARYAAEDPWGPSGPQDWQTEVLRILRQSL